MNENEREEPEETELPSTETARPGGAAGGAESLPSSIGKYRILAKLGEGGMGVVYEAEQDSPRRKVAVKVVRGGQFVDEHRVRMLQREAETLARLKHANIAAIYESGRTEDGQHFFAMELVRGKTLDRYIKKRPEVSSRAELHQRLRLFRKIGDAVHYAHQRGVIHRDLKPSNIVVTDEAIREDSAPSGSLPEIKILDFGLARITEGDIATATLSTRAGDIKGTLAYMSPEQARGRPDEIDVRTDVYALGMILYEMLSGTRPYDVMHKALAEAVRVICEEPPRSFRQTISGIRRVDPDIETIVGKALEKEAERRYPSAAALSEDVGRYLTSQPILARPPSATYQLKKFAERNRALVGGVAATFLVLVAGITVSTVFGVREARQRREAERARNDLEQVVDFQAGMLDNLEPDQMGRRLMENLRERVAGAATRRGASEAEAQASVATFEESMTGVNTTDAALQVVDEDILDRAGDAIDERFGDRPLIAARLEHTLGNTFAELALLEQSEKHATRAVELRERELGVDHPQTLEAKFALATTYFDQGRYAEAEAMYLEVLRARVGVLGGEHSDTLRCKNNLANLYAAVGRYDEGEALLRDTLESGRRALGDDHPQNLATMHNLAILYADQARYAEAEALSLEVVERRRKLLGADHPDTLSAVDNLASLYEEQGRGADAEPLFLETLAIRRRVLGNDHPETQDSVTNLAILYVYQGRLAEAEPLFVEAFEARKRVLGESHPRTLNAMGNLANVYRDQGRLAEAEALYLEIVAIQERVIGENHWHTLRSVYNLATVYQFHGRPDEAESLHLRALEGRKRVLGEDHPETLSSKMLLAVLYIAQGRLAEAEPLCLEGLDGRRRALGDDHQDTIGALSVLADLYGRQGRDAEAEPLYVELIDRRRRQLGADHPLTLASVHELAALYQNQDRYDEARDLVALLLDARRGSAEAPGAGPAAKNAYAWDLLTSEPPDLRDPKTALRFALQANEQTNFENPGFLDTLSLAYHLTGDTAKAVENQKKALALVPADSPQRASLEEALAQFDAASAHEE